MREFATVEWDRAHRALASAGQLAETDPDSAASRAYYAAFHALTASGPIAEKWRDSCLGEQDTGRPAAHSLRRRDKEPFSS